MRTIRTYMLCLMLVFTYAGMTLAAEGVVLKSMISSGGESAIGAETGKSAPPETKPFWTQRKYTLPALNADADPALRSERNPFYIPAPEKIPHHFIVYTILVSHFPYPPFWPRDPSLA